MKLSTITLIAAIAAPGFAFAQQAPAGCDIQAKSVCTPASSAVLSSATGSVLLSRGTGFSEIKAGAALTAGDRIIVKQGGANVALGPTCNKKMGPNSMVTIVQRDGVLCAAGLTSDPTTVAADLATMAHGRRLPPDEASPGFGGGFFNGPAAPIAFIGGSFLALGVLSQLSDDGRPVRFPPTISQPALR